MASHKEWSDRSARPDRGSGTERVQVPWHAGPWPVSPCESRAKGRADLERTNADQRHADNAAINAREVTRVAQRQCSEEANGRGCRLRVVLEPRCSGSGEGPA